MWKSKYLCFAIQIFDMEIGAVRNSRGFYHLVAYWSFCGFPVVIIYEL